MFDEILSSSECHRCRELLQELESVAWCAPLISRFSSTDRFTRADVGFMFEVRFAAELQHMNLAPVYEAVLGDDHSSVDFRVANGDHTWNIELLSIGTSDAIKEATLQRDGFFEVSLSSINDDQRQSTAGEMILLQQKFGEKVWRDCRAIKFPSPVPKEVNVIVADVRCFSLGCHDDWDLLQIVYGENGVRRAPFPAMQHFEGKPVRGLFDSSNTQRFAAAFRERIHFVGFIAEEDYEGGEIQRKLTLLPNLQLFSSIEEIDSAVQSFPLHGIRALTI
jgi:hypothetical protein